MPNILISPNMNMPVPVVSQAPGPAWATAIVDSLGIVDAHTHSLGRGVQITPDGLNLNSDVSFILNNAINLRSARFAPQLAVLTAPIDKGSVYVVGADLYFNDLAGNQIRMTNNGSVSGAAGTITGLPSGTASANYSAGVFTFQSAISTPAAMAVGPVSIGLNSANSKTVTLIPNAMQASNFTLTFPSALPTQVNAVKLTDTSGNESWSLGGLIPLGCAIASFPNLTGAYNCTATTAADSFGYVQCDGQTIADATSPMNGQVIPNINSRIFLMGSTTAGTASGGTNTRSFAHTHDTDSRLTDYSGTHTHTIASHTHQFSHNHQQNTSVPVPGGSTQYQAAGSNYTYNNTNTTTGGTGTLTSDNNSAIAITLAHVHATNSQSASTLDVTPVYITAKYIMRIR